MRTSFVEHIQQREEHWVIADLVGKGRHVRTIPVPTWVKKGSGQLVDRRRYRHGTDISVWSHPE